jgi:hypothetical protein
MKIGLDYAFLRGIYFGAERGMILAEMAGDGFFEPPFPGLTFLRRAK